MKYIIFLLCIFSSFLNAKYLIFDDSKNEYTIEQIKKNHLEIFKETNKTSLGATKSTVWLKIILDNKKNKTIHKYLRFREAFLYEINLYDEKFILKGGSVISFKNRQLPYVTDSFEVLVPANSSKNIFVKITPKYNATYAYDIFASKEEFLEHQNFYDQIFLAYLSVMLVILIGGLILLVIFKQKLFASYIFFVFITILFQLFQTGRVLEFVHIAEIVKYDELMAMLVVLSICLFLSTLFKKEIEDYKFLKKMFKIVFVILTIGISILIINFNFYIDIFIELVILNFSLTSIIFFVLFIVFKKVKYSLFVLIGMFVFILTSFLCAIYYIGIIDNPYSLVLMQISAVIEAVAFFSLILYKVYNQIIAEKEKSDKYASSIHEMQVLAKMGTWIEYVNENYSVIDNATKKILEIAKNIVSDKDLVNIIHPDDIKSVNEIRQRIIEKQDINSNKFRIITPNGKVKYLSSHWQYNYDKFGKLVFTEGYIVDNTEKVLAQQELQSQEALLMHQQKLAQQGEMLNMIAHQWRQPLTAITATTNSLILKNIINKSLNSEDLNKELTLITQYSQYLSSTINDFRNFFESDKIKVTNSLEELVENSLKIIKTSMEANDIELIKNYNCKKLVTSYSNEIQQVILNILKNAEDVLLQRDIQNKKIFINTSFDKDYAILEISDNAGGIDKNIINRVFEAYFSTKKSQEGTGLGLYMSKTIINEHCNGKLSVANNEHGAVFKIKLKLDKEV